jgi:hypothetical protein
MRRATAVLVLAAMLAIGGPAAVAAAHQPRLQFRKVRVPPGMAVYEWHNAGDLSTAQVERRLRFLRANDFHTVYLEVGNYLDAAELPDSDPGKQARLSAVRRQIKRFVATAAGFGLSVQALSGAPTWTGELAYLGPKLVELVGAYNTRVRSGERLKGVHLDLEPYTLPGWLDDEHVEDNLVEYLTTRSRASSRPTGPSWSGRPTAASSWAWPSRSGWTPAATPPARSTSTAPPSRPSTTSST